MKKELISFLNCIENDEIGRFFDKEFKKLSYIQRPLAEINILQNQERTLHDPDYYEISKKYFKQLIKTKQVKDISFRKLITEHLDGNYNYKNFLKELFENLFLQPFECGEIVKINSKEFRDYAVCLNGKTFYDLQIGYAVIHSNGEVWIDHVDVFSVYKTTPEEIGKDSPIMLLSEFVKSNTYQDVYDFALKHNYQNYEGTPLDFSQDNPFKI